MFEDLGGGASRSTEPASGSSTGTDVSLREHIAELAYERTLRLEQVGNERTLRLQAENVHTREIVKLQREADQLAIGKALDASKELAEKHNDLIRTGEKKDENYATKEDVGRLERFQSRLTGMGILLLAMGIGNFVKLWLGG